MRELLAVLGHPIAHSLSPTMHRAALAELEADFEYLAFDIAPDDLGPAVDGLRAIGARGFNVTLPYKEAMMPLVNRLEDDAKAIGAVNTVIRDGRHWVGTNTDAAGLVRSLEEASVTLHGARVMILGAGGAARAAVVGIRQAGAEIVVAARQTEKARSLASELGAERGIGLDGSELASILSRCDLLVQATSATLHTASAAEFVRQIPIRVMPRDGAVVDLVYRPRKTALLEAAEAEGIRTVDGLGMLVHQGALALERWIGRPAPVATMRRALETALRA